MDNIGCINNGNILLIMQKKLYLIVLLITPLTLNAALEGSVRTQFVNLTKQACFNRQRSSPINKNVQDAVLKQYCSCYAIKMADIPVFTNSHKISGSEMAPYANQAGSYCGDNYANY